MKVAFWVSIYLAVAAALLAVALAPARGGKDLEGRRMLSAELGLISALTSSALEAHSPDELADSLAGYRLGCSIHVADGGGVRLIVGAERDLPRPLPRAQELVTEPPEGGWLVWRFKKNADGSAVVASAHLSRTPKGPGRALGIAGLVILGVAGCAHAALSVKKERVEACRLKPRSQEGPPVRGIVPRPGSRRALGLAPGRAAGLAELARSNLLKQLVRRVRRCA